MLNVKLSENSLVYVCNLSFNFNLNLNREKIINLQKMYNIDKKLKNPVYSTNIKNR